MATATKTATTHKVATVPAPRKVATHTPTVGILQALDSALSTIRKHNSTVPGAIAVALGTGRGKVHGHFQAESWEDTAGEHKGSARHEIHMATESLARGAEATLTTLIHEAVHAAMHAEGVKGTSRGGQYHNQAFAAAAVKAGLVIEADSRNGFRTTGLDTSAKVSYSRDLIKLAEALSTFRKPVEKKVAAPTTIKVACECVKESGSPLSVSLPIKYYEMTDLHCKVCDSALLPL